MQRICSSSCHVSPLAQCEDTGSFVNFRYSAGQHFGRHIDESVDLEDGKRTHYTLLIYLSGSNTKSNSKSNSSKKNDSSSAEPLVGGETVFYGSRNSIVAEVTPK